MPRPKVPPNQRRRAAEACNACRATKKRCSATVPCTQCQRRGKADSCFIPQKQQSQSANTSNETRSSYAFETELGLEPVETIPQVAQQHDALPLPSPPASLGPQRGTAHHSANDGLGQRNGSRRARTDRANHKLSSVPSQDLLRAEREPRSRMLLNSRGEQVYIGGAASLSFLQLVRDIVLESIGPSQFTHNASSESMLETQSPTAMPKTLVSTAPVLSSEQARKFVAVYFAATGGFLDVFLPTETERLLVAGSGIESFGSDPYERAAMWLALAIGAQCDSPASSQQVGQPYFVQAQQLAFGAMLEDPNVEMVRVFLLMAFYMLGECRRNAAFMYLGVAARAAIALGLHSRASYGKTNEPKYQLRIKVWFSLCTLEITVCSILGRPSSAVARQSEKDKALLDLLERSTDCETAPLVASYKILKIIHESIERLYSQKAISVALVEEYLDRIEEWRNSLPDSLQTSKTASGSSQQASPKASVASVHVSCLYYFGVTLITRPFLISTLTSRPSVQTPSQSQLASACLDAAVYLVQTCVDTRKAGFLLGNMCIMKALVFAAGLILGFDLFATPRAVDHEIETAFHGARDILELIALQSPQAAHYGEILGLLNSAVGKQREKLSARGRGGRHVKRLFSLDNTNINDNDMSILPRHTIAQEPERDSLAEVGAGNANLINSSNYLSEHQQLHPLPTDSEGDPFLGWDSLDLSQWDNFPFMSPRSIGFDFG